MADREILVSLRNITSQIGQNLIHKDLNLDIRQGEILVQPRTNNTVGNGAIPVATTAHLNPAVRLQAHAPACCVCNGDIERAATEVVDDKNSIRGA